MLNAFTRADKMLNALVMQNKVPGLSISVEQNNQVLLQRGYGFAHIETRIPVDPLKTIFRIASASKPIAATALAHMVEEGILNLDASFYDYVPYYPKKSEDFTIRQLAGHTAGLRGYRGKEYALNLPLDIKESIDIFKDDELLFKPGSDYFYTSYDWVLVSLAMQEVSAIPFAEYVEQNVLKPLGLFNTYPESPHDRNSNWATFYTRKASGFKPAVAVNNLYKLAGGGYLSTSADLAKLGKAYLDKKIVNETVVDEFITSQKIGDTPTYYGLGWQSSFDNKGRPYYGHIGNGVGGYSNFYIYPQQEIVIAILINCTDPKVQMELDSIIDVFLSTELLG
ncbi:serine hydrolase domain-containing protein [uncultured Eudoraea sp.]|uniref:serine hydrolase domain-containing protein n=1 Tax=uncultured Eudoraea sp. TaxID=1035614 RepID=UPI0034583899